MGSNTEIVISTRQICRHYSMGGDVIRAVEDVSLDVHAGEFVALLGASGSGKSTLLNLIAGLDRPTSGDLAVGGRKLATMNAEELARHRRESVGMVFQAFNLIGSMTVVENVELPMRFAEVERGMREARAREALKEVGLTARMRHRPGELSGGEQQRVALARALVNRPKVLLADEPTGNLDSRTGQDILELLRKCNQTLGMTALMVTHERALAERFATRIFVMADGKLLSDPSLSPAVNQQHIAECVLPATAIGYSVEMRDESL
ncbi:MAG: ABC transporter ATP-binding protein [Terriglobales bacterium]